ncbi:MAG TPA: GntR family transcriptional regulator [Eoetvoesiella sp.]
MHSFQSDPIALYVRIASILKGRILNGDWPAGTRLPGVGELSETYNVARATARQALQRLVTEGLISSQRGKGSFVTYRPLPAQEIEDGLFRVFTPHAEGHEIRILSRESAVKLPSLLHCNGKPAASYTKIRKIHLQGGIPYGYFEVFIATDVYARFPDRADEQRKTIMLMVDAGIQVTTGQETLTMHGADWEEAQQLDYQIAMPVARITRIMMDRTRQILYAAVNNYRGDRFQQHRKFVGYFHEEPGASNLVTSDDAVLLVDSLKR